MNCVGLCIVILYDNLVICEELCMIFKYFQNLQSQMAEFEASAEPLQDWLNNTEVRVQESSARLHDLPAKKQELSKLQVLHTGHLSAFVILNH